MEGETGPRPSYFTGARPEVAVHVPAGAQRVLELGCGAGMLGRGLKARGVPEVVGVELDAHAAAQAATGLDRVLTGDLETMAFPFPEGYFDVLVAADVLEHLRDPWGLLRRLHPLLTHGATVIVSLPNVRYFGLLNHVVEGNWTYAEEGILDRTHLRFFTIKEMVGLLAGAGLRLTGVYENVHASLEENPPTAYPATFRLGRITLEPLNEFEYRDLFVFQYILVAIRD